VSYACKGGLEEGEEKTGKGGVERRGISVIMLIKSFVLE
jgi:hypothetical protein